MAEIDEAFHKLSNQNKTFGNIEFFFTQRKVNEDQEYLDKSLNRKNKNMSTSPLLNAVQTSMVAIVKKQKYEDWLKNEMILAIQRLCTPSELIMFISDHDLEIDTSNLQEDFNAEQSAALQSSNAHLVALDGASGGLNFVPTVALDGASGKFNIAINVALGEDSDAEKFAASQPPNLSVDHLAAKPPESNKLGNSDDISSAAMPPRPDKMPCAEHLAAMPPESDGHTDTDTAAAVAMLRPEEIFVVSEIMAANGSSIYEQGDTVDAASMVAPLTDAATMAIPCARHDVISVGPTPPPDPFDFGIRGPPPDPPYPDGTSIWLCSSISCSVCPAAPNYAKELELIDMFTDEHDVPVYTYYLISV